MVTNKLNTIVINEKPQVVAVCEVKPKNCRYEVTKAENKWKIMKLTV